MLRKFSKATACGYCVVHMIEFGDIVELHESQFVGLIEVRTQGLEEFMKLYWKQFTLARGCWMTEHVLGQRCVAQKTNCNSVKLVTHRVRIKDEAISYL